MRLPRPSGRLPRIVAWTAVGAVTLLSAGFARAEDTEPPAVIARAAIQARLGSPLASERAEAERDAVRCGRAALPWARAWARDERLALRCGGWRVLAEVGTVDDLRVALRTLDDAQPRVRTCAARAVVSLAERLPDPEAPWIPAGALPASHVGALAFALAGRLEGATGRALPACVYRLGAGIVPCLALLCSSPSVGGDVRGRAVTALAAVGGDEARRALSELADDPVMVWKAAWWEALIEIGPGAGLEAAHALVVRYALQALERAARRATLPVQDPPGFRGRLGLPFYRFIATCPPTEGIERVRSFLQGRLAACVSRRSRRVSAPLVVEIVRAHLVVSEPEEDALGNAVRATSQRRGRTDRRREELGNVLLSLEVYRDHWAVQAALTDLLEDPIEPLPATVEAWGHYLRRSRTAVELRQMALHLLQIDGEAATLAQRRLGARLLQRLGRIEPHVITALQTDLDGWLRGWALRRALEAQRAGTIGAQAVESALRRGLSDRDDGVFLFAARARGPKADEAVRERALALAVRGPRRLRPAAWGALATWLPAGSESRSGPPWRPPTGIAAVDARIRAAAAFRRRMGD